MIAAVYAALILCRESNEIVYLVSRPHRYGRLLDRISAVQSMDRLLFAAIGLLQEYGNGIRDLFKSHLYIYIYTYVYIYIYAIYHTRILYYPV